MTATQRLDLEALFAAPSYSPEEQEFRAWLKDCRDVLSDRQPDEVAYFAILNGFSRILVYSVLSYFKDAMMGTNIDSRIKFESFRLSCAIEETIRMRDNLTRNKELELMRLWEDVYHYQTNDLQEAKS